MAMAIVFIKLQHILSRDGDLISINFVNANKPVQLDNRRDVYGWIETLYSKNNKNITSIVYYKIVSTAF